MWSSVFLCTICETMATPKPPVEFCLERNKDSFLDTFNFQKLQKQRPTSVTSIFWQQWNQEKQRRTVSQPVTRLLNGECFCVCVVFFSHRQVQLDSDRPHVTSVFCIFGTKPWKQGYLGRKYFYSRTLLLGSASMPFIFFCFSLSFTFDFRSALLSESQRASTIKWGKRQISSLSLNNVYIYLRLARDGMCFSRRTQRWLSAVTRRSYKRIWKIEGSQNVFLAFTSSIQNTECHERLKFILEVLLCAVSMLSESIHVWSMYEQQQVKNACMHVTKWARQLENLSWNREPMLP